jgi:hypothetical protein
MRIAARDFTAFDLSRTFRKVREWRSFSSVNGYRHRSSLRQNPLKAFFPATTSVVFLDEPDDVSLGRVTSLLGVEARQGQAGAGLRRIRLQPD